MKNPKLIQIETWQCTVLAQRNDKIILSINPSTRELEYTNTSYCKNLKQVHDIHFQKLLEQTPGRHFHFFNKITMILGYT